MGVHPHDGDRGYGPPGAGTPYGFEVEVAAEPAGAVRCRARGDVDLASSAVLGTALTEALAARPARLVVDLAGVGFFDSSGLNVLLRLRLDAQAAGVPLTLAAPSAAVERVFELTGAGDIFTVQATA
jgi:anti-anti-sigma factor